MPSFHRYPSWLSLVFFYFLLGIQALSQYDNVQATGQETFRIDGAAAASPSSASHVDSTTLLASNGTHVNAEQLARARQVVTDAITKMRVSNKARVENPHRNNYSLKPGSLSFRRDDANAAATFTVTDEIAQAAALVAEADAATQKANGTLFRDYSLPEHVSKRRAPVQERSSDDYWMASLENLGTQPFGEDDSYKVFRNVKDFDAKGDGITDDTKAINKAISDGNRCGANCYGSSVKGAVVYFPPGTYLVSGSIVSYFHTQLVGDPTNPPVIKAASSFVGLGVISTDVYYPDGGTGIDGNSREWYINTANFYRQIRNFIIDITATDQGAYVAALHYQVAQATSLTNIEFHASSDETTTQQAIFAENGSGGFMSDLTFIGGAFGIYGGSQQFTASRLTFDRCRTAVQLIWDWGWIWREINFLSNKVGISLLSEDGVHHTGSVLVQDSSFTSVDTAILSFPPISEPKKGTTGITLDNVRFSLVKAAIADNTGKVWLDGSTTDVDTFTLGPSFFDGGSNYTTGQMSQTPRVTELTQQGGSSSVKANFFSRPKPTYVGARVVQMKHHAKGDGVTDDTAAFQSVINTYAGTETLIFVDAGSYILTDTITVPSGTKIMGQSWSQLVASGPKFSDASNPHVLFRVGAKGGETGSVEIQDLLFTNRGPTAGFVAVEWNIESDAQGSAAMWDCHVRIGGARGTDLSVADCPALKSGTNSKCSAGALMFHMTKTASAYIENMWLWVADHDLDDDNMTQVSVYVARGMLIESTKPVWLYGTASEHATFYQYGFQKAKNVLAAMIQTESAYYQPNPLPPAPFSKVVNDFPGDPDYSTCEGNAAADGCDESWAVRVVESSNITIAGAGLYSWFSTYDQACVDTQDCQSAMVEIQKPLEGIHIWNLVTIGAQKMIVSTGLKGEADVSAVDYTSVDYHPFWSQISLYSPQVDNDGSQDGDIVYVAPTVWGPGGRPTAACIAPCTLVLPPLPLGSTTTISWPPLTTSFVRSLDTGFSTYLSTLSIPAITTDEIEWWPITVKEGDPTQATFTAVQSVMPPPFIVTLPGDAATVHPTRIPEYSNGQSTSGTTTTDTAAPIFFPRPHEVTIQPQPTVSVDLSDPSDTPLTTTTTTATASSTVVYTNEVPKSTCHPGQEGCGRIDCGNFGCGGNCGKYGCDNGCGILGCGGGCGLTGCGLNCPPLIPCSGAQCPLDKCGGLGCVNGGCGTQPEGDCSPEYAEDCTFIISSTLTASPSQYSTTTKTHCTMFQACDAQDRETTRTQTAPDATYPTITVSQPMYGMVPIPTTMLASIASEFLHDEEVWDASRYNGGPAATSRACPEPEVPKPLYPTGIKCTRCRPTLRQFPAPKPVMQKAAEEFCDGRTLDFIGPVHKWVALSDDRRLYLSAEIRWKEADESADCPDGENLKPVVLGDNCVKAFQELIDCDTGDTSRGGSSYPGCMIYLITVY